MLNRILIPGILALISTALYAAEVPIYDFPLTNYSQNLSNYLPPNSADYTQPILTPSYQAAQLQQFYNHYYSSDADGLSPWSENAVSAILPIVKNNELSILKNFDNEQQDVSHQHYAENFKLHDAFWLDQLRVNMNFDEFDSLHYQDQNRAIAVANTYARELPDKAPDFYRFTIAGEGYPFDNLQDSAIWAGTPLYVISMSRDHAWSLVITPDSYFAWVDNRDIAMATPEFVKRWQTAAQRGLAAITKTQASVLDQNKEFQFSSYIGAVFPYAYSTAHTIAINIPVKDPQNHATIQVGVLEADSATLMPLPATKKNLVMLIQQLQNRPYGWGGAYFFNDCSAELKSLFTPLGIWMPRNTAQQAKMNGVVDLSDRSEADRIQLLKESGHPLLTMVYIGGHVFLYLGNDMTYQSIWGLAPPTRDKRYVIGQSVLLPLLASYPEFPDAMSLASKTYFKMIHLDQQNLVSMSPQQFARQFIYHKKEFDHER